MAKRSGARSAADLAAAKFSVTATPPRELSPEELRFWNIITSAWPLAHFNGSDAILLAQYVAALVAFDVAHAEEDFAGMDKAGRFPLAMRPGCASRQRAGPMILAAPPDAPLPPAPTMPQGRAASFSGVSTDATSSP